MTIRFGLVGTGFWSRFQLAGWRELPGTVCVAVCDRDVTKAETFGREHGIAARYSSLEAMLATERLDFVDIAASPASHAELVASAARHRLPVVCQKPMATSLEEANALVRLCQEASIPFLINENWRWQRPIRALQQHLAQGRIGRPFRARLQFATSFPVFENQPFLKDLPHFILADVGSHVLDVVRFLFGEAETIFCHTQRIHPDIRGEDVATVILQMQTGMTITCEFSYASHTEIEQFPQTYIYIEGTQGFLELGPAYQIRETVNHVTTIRTYPPPAYPWADPAYAVVHSSIVSCQQALLVALQGEGEAETTGADNVETLRLVYLAYQSAATHQAIRVQ